MLNYQIEGTGQTIIFLHGFLESISLWKHLQLSELKAQKIFIDLPGHGKSKLEDQSDSPSLNFIADEVQKIIDYHNIKNFSIVGHSMGGYVALILKERNSSCKKIVLINSNFWADSEQKKKDRIRLADIAFKGKSILIEEVIPKLFYNPTIFKKEIEEIKAEAVQMSSEAIAYASLAMRNRFDYSEFVHKKAAEFFIIQGVADHIVKLEEVVSKSNNNLALFLIEKSGHLACIENPKAVMMFLQKIFNSTIITKI